MNVKELTIATDEKKYGVVLTGMPNSERLGKRLKGDFKGVAKAIGNLSSQQLEDFVKTGQISVLGHELTNEDIKVQYLY